MLIDLVCLKNDAENDQLHQCKNKLLNYCQNMRTQ